MTDRRGPHRLLVSLLVTAALAASALISPAFGRLADIDIGGGVVVGETPRAATPLQVKPGNVAGFYLWVKNNDSANLPTFFMKAGSTATPLGGYWSNDPETGPFVGCPITEGMITCTFGELNSGEELFIVAAFTTPSTTSTSRDFCKLASGDPGYEPGTEASWRCVDFAFGANQGFVPGKNRSRGDIYHWYDFVATDGGADAAAQFPFCDRSDPDAGCNSNLLTVFNTPGATRRNVQSTLVTAPEGAFNSEHGSSGIAVADNFPFSCPSGADVETCASHEGNADEPFLGQWSDVSVNDEQPFDEFVYVKIQMYGVNPNSVDGVIHLWKDDADVWHETVIDDLCPSSSGPSEGQTTPCFWVSGSGNVTTVEFWDINNGRSRVF
jgi:hypothetical protein